MRKAKQLAALTHDGLEAEFHGASDNRKDNCWDEAIARLRELEAENDAMRANAAQSMMDLSRFHHAGDRDDGRPGFEIMASSPAVRILIESMIQTFKAMKAKNFIEQELELSPSLTHPEFDAFGPLLVTFQRKNGKSPGQLLREMSEERDALAKQLEKEKKS